jgi:intracellular septation protein
MKLSQRKIGLLLWISLALVIVLGGLTVWFHDETFIKWKPSIALWLMGLVLWGSQTFFGHNLLRETVAAQIELPDTVWQRLNFSYVAYFGLMGLLNLWIAYSFSTDAWANFHTFGSTALWIAFILGQGFYLNKHMEPKQSAEEPLP